MSKERSQADAEKNYTIFQGRKRSWVLKGDEQAATAKRDKGANRMGQEPDNRTREKGEASHRGKRLGRRGGAQGRKKGERSESRRAGRRQTRRPSAGGSAARWRVVGRGREGVLKGTKSSL